MPNPIAHPAASILFTKVGMIFSALIIGSIVPDFIHLIPQHSQDFMYNAAGLILFDVPVGFVLLLIFHTLVKWPLLSLLPEDLQRRLFKHTQGFSFGPLKHLGLILLSLLVGSLTHVIWDSFTHDYGWMVKHIAFIRLPIGGMPLYTILQTLSSIIGVIVLLYWFIRWFPTAPKSDQIPASLPSKVRKIFFILTVISLAMVEGLIIYSRILTGTRFMWEHFLMDSSTISAAFTVSFFVGTYCLVWTIKFNKTSRHAL